MCKDKCCSNKHENEHSREHEHSHEHEDAHDECCSSHDHEDSDGDCCSCYHEDNHIENNEMCASEDNEILVMKLKGLTCASCAGKIEEKIKNLDSVIDMNLNFTTSILKIKFDGNKDKLTKTVINLVTELEPDVECIVDTGRYITKKYLLEGLNCASCAGKIEKIVSNLDEVYELKLNFALSTLEVKVDKNTKDITKTINDIVTELEPDVKVIDKDNKQEAKKAKNNLTLRMLISVSFLILGFILKTSKTGFEYIPFVLSYLIVGYDIINRSLKNIKRGELFDENFLMAIASASAMFLGEYPEGIMVMLLYQVGEYFQGKAVESSRKSIASLMDIRPDYANVTIGNKVKKVNPEDIKLGDIIVIKPGEKVPLDGVVVKGISSLDTKALTGETDPRFVKENEEVLSGSLNLDGLIEVKVTKTFGESTVSKILDLVENASSKKAKTELRITKFSKIYTPIVVLIGFLTAVVPPLLFYQDFSTWILRGATFLVVSCPCALVISIPMTYFAGIGASSKNGILIKGGNYLEALSNSKYLVLDKTGTLTKGNFKVNTIESFNNFRKDEVLKFAAYAEGFSTHPIAKSIVKEFKNEINQSIIKEYTEIKGKGIKALVENEEILCGNFKFINNKIENAKEAIENGTIVYISVNETFAGYIVIKDEIKETSYEAIKSLNKLDITMLTGDRKNTAKEVADKVGIENYRYELLPEDKVNEVEKLLSNKEEKDSLLFVGDGINDAPVLARADVGIAMGGVGSDAAIEAADMIIMDDDLRKIKKSIDIAKKTKKIVNQNIFLSLSIKFVIMVFAFFGLAPMWLAVLGDVGVALLAVFNAMRVLKI